MSATAARAADSMAAQPVANGANGSALDQALPHADAASAINGAATIQDNGAAPGSIERASEHASEPPADPRPVGEGAQVMDTQPAVHADSKGWAIIVEPVAPVAPVAPPAPAPRPWVAPAPTLAERAASLRPWAEESARAAWRWVRGLSIESWIWIGIIFLAAVLRFWGLGDKPLHHDESMHAYFSLYLARPNGSYEYDPLLHGPFQFHAEAFVFGVILFFSNVFHVASAAGNPWINDTTARLLPATTGVALVAITYGLRRELGRVVAPVAAFLLAVSPTFVYFSRFLREDIYFACFTYLTVMCAVQFARKRTARWLIATTLAFVLAYATKEAIYLNVAIWGVFLAVLLVWELGHTVSRLLPPAFSDRERAILGHTGPLLLLGAIVAPTALWGLRQLNLLSTYINAHTTQTAAQVTQLENNTVTVLLWASIALAVVVIVILFRQLFFDVEPASSNVTPDAGSYAEISDLDGSHARPVGLTSRLADIRGRLDPDRQPFLHLLLGIPWVYWFVAFVAGWVLFAALYWAVSGPDGNVQTIAQDFQVGVGKGIWQGLYYWIQQQQLARGAQPWYYYLLLIPLYEQLAVVFGLAGIVRCLARPTRFRLFAVWWFVGTLIIYSWAGEKMPWLSIHILLPLMLLAAIGLEWPLREVWALIGRLAVGERLTRGRALRRPAAAVFGLTAAVVLLVPMLYGMVVLAHKDAANGPHEMMVYVQTTPDVQLVMDKLSRADALLYGGRHQLKIVVGQGEEWPFWWYLRDYSLDPHPSTYVTVDPTSLMDPTLTQKDVLLLTESDAASFLLTHPHGYRSHTYQLRSWWDEGYKPPDAGVGVPLWLSYGDVPPLHAHFNASLAITRLWDWLWQRKPFGADTGSYYTFVLVVRDGVPIQP